MSSWSRGAPGNPNPTPLPASLAPLNPALLNDFAGRRCLVTGGLGFIGSNLALALAAGGANVTVVDALVPRHGANPHNLDDAAAPIGVIEADLGDVDALEPAVSGADFVFNLAGQVSHVDSMADPLFDLEVNTRSHVGFLELLRRVNPEVTIVYTSTRQIFGHPRYLPVDEDHPVSPVDVNGVTKYATEQFHFLYAECYGLRASAVRLTNVYGPRQRLRDDFQGFLPIFLNRALRDEALTVFGDGKQERDCLYVDDVVECLLLTAISPDASGEVFNAGSDEHLSLETIAEAIVAAAGAGRVEHVPWPPDRDAIDIGSYVGNSAKAKRVLGWEPCTKFAEGIEQTVAFYRDRLPWYL
ncbi:MAG: NAD-dependent epimerase/dehydratase family protein [Acidimicrobiia bacterium]